MIWHLVSLIGTAASVCNLVAMLFYILPSLEALDPRINPLNKIE